MRTYWRRLQRQRISRRRLLGAAGVGAAGLAVVAACGGGGNGEEPGATGTPSAGKPKAGGRYVTTTAVNLDTLDPHISVAGGPATFPRIYNALLVRSVSDADFVFDDLAESYEQPDGETYVFTIRPGVKIAPNTLGIPERDLDSEDAYVSFERIRGLPEANACAFVCEWWDSHEAPDAQTYIVKTPTPYAFFLLRLGSFFNTIPPRELIQENPDRMRQNAVGAGPFVVTSYVEGQNLNMDRNINYYRTDPNNDDAQLPYFDGRDGKLIADRAARRTAFISKQSYQYEAETIDEAEDLLGQYDMFSVRDPVFTFISPTMNVTKPPFDDPKIRKAVMHSINRQEYIDIVYRGDAKPNGLVQWPLGAYALPEEELEELQKFDPELSKQLIQEAGHDLPLKIKVMFPASSTIEDHDRHLPLFLEQMKAAGFEIEQDPQDFVTWLDNYTNLDYDFSFSLNQYYETPEFVLDWQHSKGPAGSNIYGTGLQDPEVDAALEAAKQITDPDKIVDTYHEVQRMIYEKGPVFLPLVSPFSRTLYWNFVKDVPSGLGAAALYLNTPWLDL